MFSERFISSLWLTFSILDDSAETLRRSESETNLSLRSGLYLLGPHSNSILYAIYWPEDTTWDDDAISSVQRNRVTFMRYTYPKPRPPKITLLIAFLDTSQEYVINSCV